MRFVWTLSWPLILAALLIGVAFGWRAFAWQGTRYRRLAASVVAASAAAILAYGPLGLAARLQDRSEAIAHATLEYYEMGGVDARLEQGPLVRRMLLTGTADDFQRSELVRIMGEVPGVGDAVWTDRPAAKSFLLPFWAEVELLALVGLAVGLTLAYLLELRRRSRRYDRF